MIGALYVNEVLGGDYLVLNVLAVVCHKLIVVVNLFVAVYPGLYG